MARVCVKIFNLNFKLLFQAATPALENQRDKEDSVSH